MDKDKILSKSKIGLMNIGSVFLCTIAFSLKYNWSHELPTAGVDGIHMYINPDWFCALTQEQRIGLLAHESWHIALNHVGNKSRCNDRDKKLFNDAGDYVINLIITEAGMKIPPNGLLDTKYYDWTTNQVYEDLKKNTRPVNPNHDMSGDIMPLEMSVDASDALVNQLLVKALVQAEMVGEGIGKLPSDLQRTINEILNPVLPWDSILDQFLTDMAADDYTWRRPNKRFMPEHILPTAYSNALGHIIIAIDTSGSVTEKQMTEILSEITYIKTKFNPKKLTILDCDTRIHNIHEVGENDCIEDLKFSGYGGTQVAPPIDYAKAHDAQALLYFTDGQFTPYPGEVPFPLYWLIYDSPNFTSNIGEVIIYNGNT